VPGISVATLDTLQPYITDDSPNQQDELGMCCPLHDDKNRSASVNVVKGLWYCEFCDVGGAASVLARKVKGGDVFPPPTDAIRAGNKRSSTYVEELSQTKVDGWHSHLLADKENLGKLRKTKGLNLEIIKHFRIGWDSHLLHPAYTIPVYDSKGVLRDVRRYQIDVTRNTKIWSISGHGGKKLYPIIGVEWHEEVIICEGEWDALLTIQHGFDAVTRTSTADAWLSDWNELFRDKIVYLIHDMDVKGQEANRKIGYQLRGVAAGVFAVSLPYEITEKHGKDLSDFWMDGYTPEDLQALMEEARSKEIPPPEDLEVAEVSDGVGIPVSIQDTYDSKLVNQTLSFVGTVIGKKETWTVPQTVTFKCDMSAGIKCLTCKMSDEEGGYGGNYVLGISPYNPLNLSIAGSSNAQVSELLRAEVGIAPKCPVYRAEVLNSTSMEEIFIRPSIDSGPADWEKDGSGTYVVRKMHSVGTHNTESNLIAKGLGMIHPNPRSQATEVLAWSMERTEGEFEKFRVTDKTLKHLKMFQSGKSLPLAKLERLAFDMMEEVTKIHGRLELHMLLLLTMHSAISFPVFGEVEERGWLDVLVIGDTRTGKTRAARKLLDHFQGGKLVSGETATFAGVVGGSKQVRDEWVTTWGVVPLNDRRLVVIDEVSGLSKDDIGRMSSIRSSGRAEIISIAGAETNSRTRLVFLGNPRDGRYMSDYPYYMHAIPELIGKPEDIARFDLAMAVAKEEVAAEVINAEDDGPGNPKHYSEACHSLMMWAWSRKPDQFEWEPGAETLILEESVRMGDAFVENPPLVQAANVRYKIARIAVALALATFSSDDEGERVYIKKRHVEGAVKFIHKVYDMPKFGYGDVSRDAKRARQVATITIVEAIDFLESFDGLVQFLFDQQGKFKVPDAEAMLNLSREDARPMISKLNGFGVVEMRDGFVYTTQFGNELIRKIKEEK